MSFEIEKSIKLLIGGLEEEYSPGLSISELEDMGIPVPEALFKISSMLSDFDYTVDQAECISKYCINYIRMYDLYDKDIGKLLSPIIDELLSIVDDPCVECSPMVKIEKEGILFVV